MLILELQALVSSATVILSLPVLSAVRDMFAAFGHVITTPAAEVQARGLSALPYGIVHGIWNTLRDFTMAPLAELQRFAGLLASAGKLIADHPDNQTASSPDATSTHRWHNTTLAAIPLAILRVLVNISSAVASTSFAVRRYLDPR
jgi:hypothetical protein